MNEGENTIEVTSSEKKTKIYDILPDVNVDRTQTAEHLLKTIAPLITADAVKKITLPKDIAPKLRRWSVIDKFLSDNGFSLATITENFFEFSKYEEMALNQLKAGLIEKKEKPKKIEKALTDAKGAWIHLRNCTFTLPWQEAMKEPDGVNIVGNFAQHMALKKIDEEDISSEKFAREILDYIQTNKITSRFYAPLFHLRSRLKPYGVDKNEDLHKYVEQLSQSPEIKKMYLNALTQMGTILWRNEVSYTDYAEKPGDYRHLLDAEITSAKLKDFMDQVERYLEEEKKKEKEKETLPAPSREDSLASSSGPSQVIMGPGVNNMTLDPTIAQILEDSSSAITFGDIVEKLALSDVPVPLRLLNSGEACLFDRKLQEKISPLDARTFFEEPKFRSFILAKRKWSKQFPEDKYVSDAFNYIQRVFFTNELKIHRTTKMSAAESQELQAHKTQFLEWLELDATYHKDLENNPTALAEKILAAVRDPNTSSHVANFYKLRSQIIPHLLDDDIDAVIKQGSQIIDKKKRSRLRVDAMQIATYLMQNNIPYERYLEHPQYYEKEISKIQSSNTLSTTFTLIRSHLKKVVDNRTSAAKSAREAALADGQSSAVVATLMYELCDQAVAALIPRSSEFGRSLAEGQSESNLGSFYRCFSEAEQDAPTNMNEAFNRLRHLSNAKDLSSLPAELRSLQNIQRFARSLSLTTTEWEEMGKSLFRFAERAELKERDFGVLASSWSFRLTEQQGVAGRKRAYGEVEGSEEEMALTALHKIYGDDMEWNKPTARWVRQADGAGTDLLTFFQQIDNGEMVPILNEKNEPLQLSKKKVEELGVNPDGFKKRARLAPSSDSDVDMEEAAFDDDVPTQAEESAPPLWEVMESESIDPEIERIEGEKAEEDRKNREHGLAIGQPKAMVDTFMYELCDVVANARTSTQTGLYEQLVAKTSDDSTLQELLCIDLDVDLAAKDPENPTLSDLFVWLDKLRNTRNPAEAPDALKTPEAIREMCEKLKLTKEEWQELAMKLPHQAEKWKLREKVFPIVIKGEPRDADISPLIPEPTVHKETRDENTDLFSWRIPRFIESEDGFLETIEKETMVMTTAAPAKWRWDNFRWPIRRLDDPSKIAEEYAKDAEGLECHKNVECTRVEISKNDRKQIVQLYRKILKNPNDYFTDVDPEVKEAALVQYKEAVKSPNKYFRKLEEQMRQTWMLMKENKAPPNAQLFDTPRLEAHQTKSTELIKSFGRVLKNPQKQAVGEAVDVFASVSISKNDLEAIGKYIDEYGKDRFENYAVLGLDGNYYAPVGAQHPASLMNDENPSIVGGKTIGTHSIGDMLTIEPKVYLTNKYGQPRSLHYPHTLQIKPTQGRLETTLSYDFQKPIYWQGRLKELDTEENHQQFYDKVVGPHVRTDQFRANWKMQNQKDYSDVKFIGAIKGACKKIMSRAIETGDASELLVVEQEQRKRWRNWHIKGFKLNITGKPVNVLVSFSDRAGTRIDDIRVVPRQKTQQAIFEEMRSEMLTKVGKDVISVPGFPLTPKLRVKQEHPEEDVVMHDTNVTNLPMRGDRGITTAQPGSSAVVAGPPSQAPTGRSTRSGKKR